MSEHKRKKRFEVYSLAEAGNPLLVDRFDLREQAEMTIRRIQDVHEEMPRELYVRRPRLMLVDTWMGEAESVSECMR